MEDSPRYKKEDFDKKNWITSKKAYSTQQHSEPAVFSNFILIFFLKKTGRVNSMRYSSSSRSVHPELMTPVLRFKETKLERADF